MKKLFIKSTNWLLAGIMALFGFAGCKYDTPLYGVPSADYTVKGTVVNEKDGKPITGIRVGFFPVGWHEDAFGPKPEYYLGPETFVISNTNGGFTLTNRDYGSFRVYLEDIDGEENGLFQPKKVDVDFSGASGSWDIGEFTVTTTIQLAEVEIE